MIQWSCDIFIHSWCDIFIDVNEWKCIEYDKNLPSSWKYISWYIVKYSKIVVYCILYIVHTCHIMLSKRNATTISGLRTTYCERLSILYKYPLINCYCTRVAYISNVYMFVFHLTTSIICVCFDSSKNTN
jgi:hypothetical protein